MINIQQPNQVKEENEPTEFRQVQTSLDDKIYEFVPNTMYAANSVQAVSNPSYVAVTNPITNSQVVSTFNFPVGVFNHSKTTFNMNVSIGNINVSPITALGSPNIVAAINNFYCPFIKSIEFYTNAGIRLFYCDSVDKLNRLSGILNLEQDQGSLRGFITPSQRNYISPSVASANYTSLLNGFPDPFINTSVALPSAAGNLGSQFIPQSIQDPSVMFCPYNQVVNSGVFGTGDALLGPTAAAAIVTVAKYSFRLGDLLPDSIFNTKKDIYFSKMSTIKITFNPINQIGALVQLDSSNVAPTLYAFGPGISSVGTAGYQIQNMEIITYSQNNQKIVDEIIQSQMTESIPIVLPFVQSLTQAFNASVSQNATFKISTENSVSSLYKLYYGLFQPDVVPITCSSENINEQIWTNTMVRINNTTIRSYIDLSKREDISEMNEFFPYNSLTSYRAARYSGVYGIVLDTEPCKKHYTGSDIKGLELKPSNDLIINYSTTTTGAAYTHFLFAVQNRVYFWKGGEAYLIKQI